MIGSRVRLFGAAALVALGAGLSACDEPTGLRDRLEVWYDVAPARVEPGGETSVTFAVRNTSSDPVTLAGDPFCGGALSLAEASEQDLLQGMRVLCIVPVESVTIGPDETRTWTWELLAKWDSGPDLRPGRYTLLLRWEALWDEAFRATLEVGPGA